MWGCSHENEARKAYIASQCLSHVDFKVEEAGLFLSYNHPYIGAIPDGMISCKCCGKGTLELKCPYCVRDTFIEAGPVSFYMKQHDGSWELSREHAYYYQVQVQMNVCEVEYGDFVVWTTHELVMERIKRDEEFYQAGVQKVEQFFCYSILPEIIGKWYTRGRECTTDQNSSATTIGMANIQR